LRLKNIPLPGNIPGFSKSSVKKEDIVCVCGAPPRATPSPAPSRSGVRFEYGKFRVCFGIIVWRPSPRHTVPSSAPLTLSAALGSVSRPPPPDGVSFRKCFGNPIRTGWYGETRYKFSSRVVLRYRRRLHFCVLSCGSSCQCHVFLVTKRKQAEACHGSIVRLSCK